MKSSTKSNSSKDSKKNGNKGKYSQRDTKGRAARNGRDSEGKHCAAGNDLTWYVPNEQILKDAASLNFSNVLGRTYGSMRTHASSIYDWNADLYMPGIMAIEYYPTFGTIYSKDATDGDPSDALNVSSKSMYSFVRHANSGHSNYDAQDLSMYIMAMDSIYQWWAYLVRIYGTYRLFSYNNKYYPAAILRAMGISGDVSALYDDMPALRAHINNLALQLSSYAVPSNLPIIQRHLWMTRSVFMDDTGNKAQSYVYVPKGFYEWKEFTTTTENPSAPRLILDGRPVLKADNFMSAVTAFTKRLLTPITSSETFGIMSGDILKAYGANGIFAFAMMDENYVIQPEFSVDIATQIHNITVTEIIPGAVQQNVKSGLLYQNTDIDFTNLAIPRAAFLDIKKDDVTPADVMYATRLLAIPYDGSEYPKQLVCGTEIVANINIYVMAENGSINNLGFNQYARWDQNAEPSTATVQGPNSDSFAVLESIGYATQFKWGPLMYMWLGNTALDTEAFLLGDTDNVIRLDSTTLKRIHDCAINGEFGLPFVLTQI